jgi:trehalose-phosphatase
MKHLFEAWIDLQDRIQRARVVYLLFDYDGTLTLIVSRPDLALCPPEVRRELAELRDDSRVGVAIISGRSLEDLYGLIGVPGITYVGNHGLEIRNPAGTHTKKLSSGRQKELTRIAKFLGAALGNLPGIIFEDKKVNLAVHYRQVPKAFQEKVFREVKEIGREWGNHWRVTEGKMVFEIQPRVDFHKGLAVRNLLKGLPEAGMLPFYFGDDRTDEDAFRFLKGTGVAVFVGPPETPSAAEYFLETPEKVAEFFKRFRATRPGKDSGAFQN